MERRWIVGGWEPGAKVALIACALILVPVLLGSPSVFTDTAFYYAQGEYFAHRLHLWPHDIDAARLRDPTVLLGAGGAEYEKNLRFMAARSPTYGLFLYLSERIGSLWLLAALQSLAAAWIISLWSRAAFGTLTWRMSAVLALVLATSTSLPFFTSFAMPDVFAALAIVAVATLLFYGDRLARWERILALLLVAAAVGFHTATAIIVGAVALLGVAAILACRIPRKSLARVVALVFAAIALGGAPNAALQGFYTQDTGYEQRRPPFLMARLFVDGPGRDYLRRHCPGGASPALCRFVSVASRTEAEFLWSGDPRRAVAATPGEPVQENLRSEEMAFVVAAFKADPAGVASAGAKNTLAQLASFGVVEPNIAPVIYARNPYWSKTSVAYISRGLPWRSDPSRNRLNKITVPLLWWHRFVVLGSGAVAAYAWMRAPRVENYSATVSSDQKIFLASILVVVLAIVINAGVCGGLSGAFPRYGARVIWLLPTAALFVIWAVHSLKSRASSKTVVEP